VLCFGITHAQNDYLNYQNLTKNLKAIDAKSNALSNQSEKQWRQRNMVVNNFWINYSQTSLITAGLDGKSRAGTQIALKMIENIKQR
jgi:hypothetical protein